MQLHDKLLCTYMFKSYRTVSLKNVAFEIFCLAAILNVGSDVYVEN